MRPGPSAGAVKVIQSGPGLARVPPWTDAAARTIKKFLSNECPLHANRGVLRSPLCRAIRDWKLRSPIMRRARRPPGSGVRTARRSYGPTPLRPRFLALSRPRAVRADFDSKHPAAIEIMRLAETLPPPGQMRLERLRGFGGSFGRAVTCLCSRVAPDNGGAIFLVATEPVGPTLPLRERVSRLFANTGKPLLVFTPDGKLLYATPPAQARFAAIQSASALGPALFNQALTAGSAGGATPQGNVTIERLGTETSAVLIADFDTQPSAGSAADLVAANTASAASHRRDEPAAERRHPLRFVWQMDTEGRFVVGSDEFMELMGPRTTAAFGRLWREIAADLKLDPDGQIARAVATHETWSGITVLWPVDDGGERLPVELSGLPVFDRDHLFRGYRGFGVCRDLDRINHLARARRERPIGFMAPPQAAAEEAGAIAAEPEPPIAVESAAGETAANATPHEPAAMTPEEADGAALAPPERPSIAGHTSIAVVPAAANVVPFRTGTPPETKVPALSPVERKAFRELAEELTARLQGVREDLVEQGPGALQTEDQAPAGPPPLPTASEALLAAPAPVSAAQDAGGQIVRQGIASFAPALLDRLPLGVLIYRRADPGEIFLYANRYVLELSGCQDLDALGARGGLSKLFAEPAADALAEGGSPQPLSIVSRDGSRRPVEGRLIRVPWDNASALALILSNGEAEERKRAHVLSLESAQIEIRELKAHVEAFKKTEAEMRAATREAQRAAAAKSEFVAKISHEIRTPLNAIIGLFRSDDAGALRPDRQRALPAISQGHPCLRRASRLAAQRPARSVQDRGRQARSQLRQCRSQRADAAKRRADAAAGQPRAHHHPHLAGARRCRR